ncbi:hypothetical protein J7J26_04355 [Candidatus Micrarchaeota archaeon]|nr:hypothetical protein [Candidatus Micrarchaeota archaeon]
MALENLEMYAQNLGQQFAFSAVNIAMGIIVIAIGAIVAWILGVITRYAINLLKVDEKIKKHKLEKGLLGFKVSELAKLFVELIVFFAFAASASYMYFPFPALTELLYNGLNVSKELLVFAVVIFSGLLIAEYVSNRIKDSKISFAKTWGTLVEIFIALISLSVALNSLTFLNYNEIIDKLIVIFMWAIAGFAVALGLGFGIAIGLGGKDMVRSILKKKQAQFEKLI